MSSYLTLKPWLKSRLEECSKILKEYLSQLDAIEKDINTPESQRITQIKKIRDEITKVGTEIDSIKKEIMLLKDYSIN